MKLPKCRTISLKVSTIDELSDDLLVAIFHHLPFPVLLQCKSVNKRFFRLISNSSFLHKPFETHSFFLLFNFHSSSNYDKKMLFSINSNNKTHILKGSNFLPLSWPQDRDQVRVKATHYDLLLCSAQSHCYTHYFVCNPFTKKCVTLPPIRKNHAQELACVGFICDQSRSRFRVMHIPIMCFEFFKSFQVNMFSSETCEWSASNVTVPYWIIMSNLCSKNILVCNEKFVWWIEELGVLVCDPFSGLNSKWEIIHWYNRSIDFDGSRKYDIYNGICNGRVKILLFSKTYLECEIRELVNFEKRTWSISYFILTGISIKNMKFLALHPQCDSVLYLYSKEGIFLCDYRNNKVESLYKAAEDEDIHAWGNVMSLSVPQWPTPVPTFNANNSCS